MADQKNNSSELAEILLRNLEKNLADPDSYEEEKIEKAKRVKVLEYPPTEEGEDSREE